jgi:hypothetical protein
MAHKSQMLFIGHYDGVADASADYDAVAAAHDSGETGHLEVAVVTRDVTGALTLPRHARMGGMHLGHGPSNELKAGTQYLERGSVALLVVGDDDDAKAVDAAVTRATARDSQPVDHAYTGGSGVSFAEDTGAGDIGSGQEGRLT